jgi:peptide-methionine (R)-S-oxide reductase
MRSHGDRRIACRCDSREDFVSECLPEEDDMEFKVQKTDAEWREEISREEYQVLRKAATERAWTGALLDEKRSGVYTCKACGADLFRSAAKFESGSGWPSFFEPVSEGAVSLKRDVAFGMVRTEVLCAACGSHLGHLFDDAPQTPTGDRYCMNSISLEFEEKV